MPESLVLVVVVHEVVEAGGSGIAAMLAAVWPSGSHTLSCGGCRSVWWNAPHAITRHLKVLGHESAECSLPLRQLGHSD